MDEIGSEATVEFTIIYIVDVTYLCVFVLVYLD